MGERGARVGKRGARVGKRGARVGKRGARVVLLSGAAERCCAGAQVHVVHRCMWCTGVCGRCRIRSSGGWCREDQGTLMGCLQALHC